MLNHGVLYLVGLHGYSIKLRRKKKSATALEDFCQILSCFGH